MRDRGHARGLRVSPAGAVQSPLCDGSVISLGSPEGCVYPEPAGLIEIRVAGGPAAGAVHRLSLGETTIGSGQTAAIRLNDPQVAEFALHITVDRRVAPPRNR